MLKINNELIENYTTEIKYANAQHNQDFGYSIVIGIEYEKDNQKGYISFFVDFFDTNDFHNIVNKKYEGNPSDLDATISMFEMFDTKEFIDYVDSNVTVQFKDIIDNNIETKINVDDDATKIEFDGLLYIKK